MSAPTRVRRRPRLLCAVVVLAALALPACKEVVSESATGYEPAKLAAVRGRDDVKLVTFTAEGARRAGLRTAVVRPRAGHGAVVPYAALIYDAEGGTYVYTSPRPLSFVRAEVKVDRIDGGRVFLAKGPRAGTRVVTVGSTQVYGVELDVAGSH